MSRRPECPFFKRSGSASPERPLQFEPRVEHNGESLPVFGEERNYNPRSSDSIARFYVVGICDAIQRQVVAVEKHRYENDCMQAQDNGHEGCGRYIQGENETIKPSTPCAPGSLMRTK